MSETASGSCPGPGVEPGGYVSKTVIWHFQLVDLCVERRPKFKYVVFFHMLQDVPNFIAFRTAICH